LRERAKKIDQGILVIRQVGLIAVMQQILTLRTVRRDSAKHVTD